MELAIIGLPQSGKTTLFNALTRGRADSAGHRGPGGGARVGAVKVPDSRLDTLGGMYPRHKVVHAEIKYWDLPGAESAVRSPGIGGLSRNILQGADGFLVVVRAFADPGVPHPLGGVDPGRDLGAMLSELAFVDLEVLERAVARLEGDIKKSPVAERPVLVRNLGAVQRVRESLEAGCPLRRQQLADSEAACLVDYQLLTGKPVVVVFNADESGPLPSLSRLKLDGAEVAGLGEVSLCGKLEAELALMSPEEEAEFREALQIAESALTKVIRVSYQTLGLSSFLTIGDQEVQAWSVPSGLPAREAAGHIHSDFYRGFIRAEVIPYPKLVRCGSMAQARKEGALRSEGKDYPVQDGDVIHFLVNV